MPALAAGAGDGPAGLARHPGRCVVLAVSVLGTVVGLWGRWQATRTTKRVQVAVRRRVFEHAVRLPLHRVYQLKSGRRGEPAPRGCRRRRRADLQHALQPLAGGRPVRWAGWSCWPGSTGGCCSASLVPGAGGLLFRPALEPAARGRSSATSASSARRSTPGRRGVRRHAGGARLRPAAQRVGAVHRREPLHGPAGAVRLVAVAAVEVALGVAPARPPRRRCCSTAGSRCSTAGSRWAT